ncbi:hypothetical protein AA0119_g1994 [Alternaria tenuissima]|uniref:Protein kinase domain-containing protein n=1 Tax=Alternaria tenuissima TaxID=119927 RepID=A0AB37WJT0_9PLEO|nr:hypothetical protein AA0115_g5061 [Alternaria tenuissima]RYO07479.1 hypothetical protein AA0119_g1994 [Alternaria tenuissima]RYO20272.1 hypothetical protein AA0121_g4028 [Alternaria tenuissima]
MAHDYRSPLDHENKELIRFDNPRRDPRRAHSIFHIPPTDAPVDYVNTATGFLEAEYADPVSPIHQDPKLPTPPKSDEAPSKPLKTVDDIFNAARIWLKCPLDHAIVIRYPTELGQRNGYLGDGLVTLYYESFTRTHAPKMVMMIKWLSPHELASIVQGNVIDRRYVEEAEVLDSRYIALCDYEHLVLLNFGSFSEPHVLRVTAVPRDSMRLAFLGFLLEACHAVIGEPGRSPP